MDFVMRAVELSAAAHSAHDRLNFDHAMNVAARVKEDPRASDLHVASAYLIGIEQHAHMTGSDLILAGVPGDVVRAVRALEMRPNESFLSYLRRISENPVTALVGHHNFMQILGELNEDDDDDLTARFRRAAHELNEAVDLNTPKSG